LHIQCNSEASLYLLIYKLFLLSRIRQTRQWIKQIAEDAAIGRQRAANGQISFRKNKLEAGKIDL
jgi:hypothetical protein